MLKTIEFKDIEDKLDKFVIIDVRSPSEYIESTITGAHNIPLFNDDERAHVGTVYKQVGKADAVKLGIDYVSRSLPSIYQNFAQLHQKGKKFLILCARGGMRSETIAGLISALGFPTFKLIDGYKGYRQHIINAIPLLAERVNFVTLYGKTGTGKTHLLHSIKKLGYDVLDLEKCANHRGSVLGDMGMQSQKQFESLLYDSLKNAADTVYTEGESRKIGRVTIPVSLMTKINSGVKLMIDADIETRKKIILSDYTGECFNEERVISALNHLEKYIGKTRIAEYSELIRNKEYEKVTEELMLKYYDLVYNTNDIVCERSFTNRNTDETAACIVDYINSRAKS